MRSFLVRLVLSVSCASPSRTSGAPADACTSFLIKHPAGPLMAKNYDWDVADGLLVVNPRGLAKTALVARRRQTGALDLALRQRDLQPVRTRVPHRRNERDRAGHGGSLARRNRVPRTRRPATPSSTLQWVQYCLDSFRTVADVVASASELAISGVRDPPLPRLRPDRQLRRHRVPRRQARGAERADAAAARPHQQHLQRISRIPQPHPRLWRRSGDARGTRFTRPVRQGGQRRPRRRAIAGGDPPIEETFAILADVAQPESTQWSIVYELQEGRVHFRDRRQPEDPHRRSLQARSRLHGRCPGPRSHGRRLRRRDRKAHALRRRRESRRSSAPVSPPSRSPPRPTRPSRPWPPIRRSFSAPLPRGNSPKPFVAEGRLSRTSSGGGRENVDHRFVGSYCPSVSDPVDLRHQRKTARAREDHPRARRWDRTAPRFESASDGSRTRSARWAPRPPERQSRNRSSTVRRCFRVPSGANARIS